MMSRPMTISLHRAADRTPLAIDVDQIRYFQSVTHLRAPLTRIALLEKEDEIVLESAWIIQQRCRGC